MAHTIEIYNNKITCFKREAPIGFSWTNLFFGSLVPLVRGDWKWFLIQFIIALGTCGLSGLVFPFIYNNLYIKDLVKNGFEIE